MYDHVITISGRHWPGYTRPGGVLVDFRLFGAASPEDREDLGYFPDRLRTAGVPEQLIEAAAESAPQGFVLLIG